MLVVNMPIQLVKCTFITFHNAYPMQTKSSMKVTKQATTMRAQTCQKCNSTFKDGIPKLDYSQWDLLSMAILFGDLTKMMGLYLLDQTLTHAMVDKLMALTMDTK